MSFVFHGEALRAEINSRGLTVEELSERSKVSVSTIRRALKSTPEQPMPVWDRSATDLVWALRRIPVNRDLSRLVLRPAS